MSPEELTNIESDASRRSGASTLPQALLLADNLDMARPRSPRWAIRLGFAFPSPRPAAIRRHPRQDHMALLSALASLMTNRSAPGGSSWWLVSLALFFFSAPEAPAQTTSAREYQIKAAFLFNFTQFVEWPPDAFSSPQAPLVIGVLGNDPFGPFLDEAVRDEKSQGRPIVVERYRDPGEAGRCHILFISYKESDRLDTTLKILKGRCVLTVGDTAGFAQRGGMIRFITVNNKVRLRVNLEATKNAGLTLSSKLLRPADIVTTNKE